MITTLILTAIGFIAGLIYGTWRMAAHRDALRAILAASSLEDAKIIATNILDPKE